MLVLILGVVIVYAVSTAAPKTTTGAAHGILRPVAVVTAWAGDALDGIASYFIGAARLERENEELRRKLSYAKARLLQQEVFQDENTAYRKMWNRATSSEGVLASVITRPPQSPYDRLVLDIGREHDIERGDQVVRAGAVLGEIETVFARSAVARLYSTSGEEVTGYVTGSDITVDLRGAGNGSFRANAPRDVSIEQGDVVTTQDAHSLVLAEVVTVDARPNDPEQHLLLQSPINLTSVRFVRVIEGNFNPYQDDDDA